MVCLQNIVLISLILAIVLVTIEITRWVLSSRQKRCHPHKSDDSQSNTAAVANASLTGNMDPSSSLMNSAAPRVVNQPWFGRPEPVLAPPVLTPAIVTPPFNQITHGVPDEWNYCGYASPVSGTKPGKAVRYPLYVRQNLYQKNGYDYYVIDDSRNHVRINIDLPRGVYQLWSGDEIHIDGEVGKWVVTIDVPPDTTWQRGFPFFPRI